MKKLFYFLLLLPPSYSFGQLNTAGTPVSFGLGWLNAATTDGDYQIGNFYNPAYLSQGTHRFDVFSSYTRRDEREGGYAFGAMVSLNKRLVLGLGYANNEEIYDWGG